MIDMAGERAIAEAEYLLDTIRFLRGDGEPTFDPETISWTDAGDPVEVWSGPASIGATTAAIVERGAAVGVAYTYVVRVPMAADGLRLGDVGVVSAVRDGGNTRLLDDRFRLRIVEMPERSTMILRRLHCQLLVNGGQL